MFNFSDSIHVAHSDSERKKIYRFRYQIYIEEMGKPYAHADHENKILTDDLDHDATLLYATQSGEVSGTVRINWGTDRKACEEFRVRFDLDRFTDYPPSNLSFASRLMVNRSLRSSSLAARLSTAAYIAGRNRRNHFNFIHCVSSLVPLFQRMGYRTYKEEFKDVEVGTQVPMVLILEDIEHLRRVRSPFLNHAEKLESQIPPQAWFQSQFDSRPFV